MFFQIILASVTICIEKKKNLDQEIKEALIIISFIHACSVSPIDL